MKKVLIYSLCSVLLFFLLQCAGTQKPDPEVTACKGTCSATLDVCIKKAVKNEAKKAACGAAKAKCENDCERK